MHLELWSNFLLLLIRNAGIRPGQMAWVKTPEAEFVVNTLIYTLR